MTEVVVQEWERGSVQLFAVNQHNALVQAHCALIAENERLRRGLEDIAGGMMPGALLNPLLDAFGATGDKLAFKEAFSGWLQQRAREALHDGGGDA